MDSDLAIDVNSLRFRILRAMPYLSLATILVAASLILTRPWEERDATGGSTGVIAQVPLASGDQVETLPYPESLAPNFRLEALNGELIELASLRGTPVFLNFWATWCFSCVTEMPAMQRVADAYEEDLVVIGINTGEEPASARDFAELNDISYLLLLDGNQDVTREYLVRSMPTSVFIRSDGTVETFRYGAISEGEMHELIAPLLAAASS